MKKKYIYIFTNTHSENVVKIGKTDRYPEIRAEQLNRQSGTIGKYEVAWFKDVPDNDIAEKIVHHCLKDFNVGKEYFDIDLSSAIQICENLLTTYFVNVVEQIENQKKQIEIENKQIEQRIEGLTLVLKYSDGVNEDKLKDKIKDLKNTLKKLSLKTTNKE